MPGGKLDFTPEETEAVLAHEIGHWARSDPLWDQAAALTWAAPRPSRRRALIPRHACSSMLGAVYLTQCLLEGDMIWDAFECCDGGRPLLVGMLLAVNYILSPLTSLLLTLSVLWTRRGEFAADRFAADAGHAAALCSALSKLEHDRAAFPVGDRVCSALWREHPLLVERLRALRDAAQRARKKEE